MHRVVRGAVPFAIAMAAAAMAAAASAQDLPKRKSGLWELKMAQGIVMTQCVDHAQDDAFRQIGRDMEKDMQCVRQPIERGAGTLSFQSSCNMAGTKVNSKTVVSGDFDKAYRLDIQTKYDPPLLGNAQTATIVEAKWLGACPAGQRAGDMTMPGGVKLNTYDMLDKKK